MNYLNVLKGTFAILTIGALVMLQSCYPQGPEFVDELDLVTTFYDDTYAFETKQTYSINDKIPLIGTDPIDYVSAVTNAVIINKIKANMLARNYELVDADANPDMHLLVGAIEVKTTVVGCGGGWWGWYPGYPGYPGYGGCWYPVGYSYSTGTILMTLWDKDSLPTGDDNDTNTPAWEAGINGLLQGSQSSINTRIESTIDQAFKQSQYIQSN